MGAGGRAEGERPEGSLKGRCRRHRDWPSPSCVSRNPLAVPGSPVRACLFVKKPQTSQGSGSFLKSAVGGSAFCAFP